MQQSIYGRCLPDGAWERLPLAVRLAHLPEVVRHGLFCIERGRWFFMRWLASWMGLPPAAKCARGNVIIHSQEDRERWVRAFDDVPFVTEQWCDSARWIVERWGNIELRFRLVPEADGIRYEQVGAALRLGLSRIPLPAMLAPRVKAVESAAGERAIRVRVVVSLPLLGRLIAYDGTVEVES